MYRDNNPDHLPTGTVTFMFTDIEGSTEVLRRVGDTRFAALIEEHNSVIRSAITGHGGVGVATEGDSVFGVFVDVSAAVEAAFAIQRGMKPVGDSNSSIRVRMGLHTGTGVLGGDNYVGIDVHRASRIADSGHGGQILVSEITARLIEDRIAGHVSIKSLGRYRLAGFPEPTTIHQVSSNGGDQEFPALRARRAESRLPAPVTEFVGRKREIAVAIDIIKDHRLLTLTGPGGSGKTRLSLEIARQYEGEFADGARFVDLASLAEPGLIPSAILDALELKTAVGIAPMDHLKRHLADRSMLLVLDNFEQLLEGAAVVSELLDEAPRVRVIVTSRTPLRLRGERELPVPPLETPEAGGEISEVAESEGVHLLISRARAVRPDFALDDENVETLAAIARSLDGLPLAIELAASRMRSLTPEVVLERLDNQLLTSRSSDVPTRQQTIVNAIGWSYDLLDEELKQLFERLSVFSGSFGLTEAEKVCQDDQNVLEGVSDLVEQSLLRQSASSGESRFRMLIPIREFAYAALVSRGIDRTLLDRHANVYMNLARVAHAEIPTSRQGYWLARLSDENDNLRGAFDHAVSTEDGTTACSLVGSLWRFWQIRGYLTEARERIETALGVPIGADPIARARALTALGGILYWQGAPAETLAPYREALGLFRQHGDEADVAEALYNVCFPLTYLEKFDESEAVLRESLEISQRTGRTVGVGHVHWAMGNVAVIRGDFAECERQMREAVAIFEGLDAPFDLGWARFMRAHSQAKMGEHSKAKTSLAAALEIFTAVSDVSAMTLNLFLLGFVMLAQADRQQSAYFVGAAHRLERDTGVALSDLEVNQYPELNEFLTELSEMEKVSFEEGKNTSLDEVIDRAIAALSQP